MKTTDITEKVWIDANGELIGPFDNQDKAQEYIDDRDDHAFDVRNWDMIVFQKWHTSATPKKEFISKNGHLYCIDNRL